MKLDWLVAAAPARPGSLFSEVLPWLAGLILVVVSGVIVIYFIRRSLGGSDAGHAGFSLQELRELRATGRLSDEEFDRAKASIIGRSSEDEQACHGTPSGTTGETKP